MLPGNGGGEEELIGKVREDSNSNNTPHTSMFKCIQICEHNCTSIPALIFTGTSSYKNLQSKVQ